MKPLMWPAIIVTLIGMAGVGLRCYRQDIEAKAELQYQVDSIIVENVQLKQRDSVRTLEINSLKERDSVIGGMVAERATVSARHRTTARAAAHDLGVLLPDTLKPALDSVRLAYESSLAAADSTIRLQAIIITNQQRIIDTQDSTLAEFRVQLARSLDLNYKAVKAQNRGLGGKILNTALAVGIGVAVGMAVK